MARFFVIVENSIQTTTKFSLCKSAKYTQDLTEIKKRKNCLGTLCRSRWRHACTVLYVYNRAHNRREEEWNFPPLPDWIFLLPLALCKNIYCRLCLLLLFFRTSDEHTQEEEEEKNTYTNGWGRAIILWKNNRGCRLMFCSRDSSMTSAHSPVFPYPLQTLQITEKGWRSG